jgi:hypothetical protein
VHGVDPVGDLAGAAQVLPLHAGRGSARLLLAGLIQRPDHHPAATAPARGPGQARDGEPAHHPHRRVRVPHGPAEQPLGLIRCPVARMLSDRPPVTPGQAAGQRTQVLPGLQPRLRPGKTRPQQAQQLPAFPRGQPRPYPGGSSRPRFCCPHKLHDRGAAALMTSQQRPGQPRSSQLKSQMAAVLLADRGLAEGEPLRGVAIIIWLGYQPVAVGVQEGVRLHGVRYMVNGELVYELELIIRIRRVPSRLQLPD